MDYWVGTDGGGAIKAAAGGCDGDRAEPRRVPDSGMGGAAERPKFPGHAQGNDQAEGG